MRLTLKTYLDGIAAWQFTAEQVLSHHLEKAKKNNEKTNAYISFADEYVHNNIAQLKDRPLAGAPIAIKDLILTKGVRTTFASKMGEDFVAPYSATCFQRLEDAGCCLLWKTNLDEFAMGWSNETSAFWPVKNPDGIDRISGWSSGGSAAAVADDTCIAALWTDTGWSVRQPAFMCWIVGMKPTYGRVSRYGVQAMASSFDQVWVMTKTVEDAATLLDIIAWQDQHDATTVDRDADKAWRKKAIANGSFAGKKIGYLKEFFNEWLDPIIAQNTKDILAQAEQQGATIIPLEFPLLKYVVAVYYVLMPAEGSTNLARFDWLRFGTQDDTSAYETIQDYYAAVREKWFGTEVKRRILIGTYVLSAWFYDAYYRKAQQVRAKMQKAFKDLFAQVDCIVGPTSPDLARKIGERINDPLKMYLADIYTIPANIGWFPAMHVPTGKIEKDGETFNLGVQIMADQWREDIVFDVGRAIEKLRG